MSTSMIPHGAVINVNISGGVGAPGGESYGKGTGGAGGTGEGPTVHLSIIAEKLEKWLQFPPAMQQKQHDTEQFHMDGTGQWLLENDKFVNWEKNGGVLWIEGNLIQQLFAQEPQSTCAVGFFYFDFRQKETQSVEIALRQIVLQISAQAPHPYETLNKHYELSKGQKLPNSQDLHGILYRLLGELGCTYIVLDALDECDDFKEIVTLVSVLRAWKETPLHLLITSQNRDVFTKGFNGVARIVLDVNVTYKDIEFFVSSELQTSSDLEPWRLNAAQIKEQIALKSNGMFRLAACLLIELAHYVYPEDEDLDTVLALLPNDLFGIYDRFILAIPKHWFPYAEAALRWIMFNYGNWGTELSLPYTYKPNRQETNKSAIPKWLAGLITVGDKAVVLAHASVQDYLLSGHFKQRFNCDLAEELSHGFISQICICYLVHLCDHPLDEEMVDKYPLAKYTAWHWYYHTINSNDKESLLSQGIQLLEDNRAVIDLVAEHSTPLIHATSWGHQETVQLLLEKGANVNLGGGEYGSPLGAACYWGRQKIAQLFLEKGADVNLGGGDYGYGSALGTACYQRHQEIVQLLLEKGADVNLAGGNYGSALGAACYQRHQEIAQLLLENGADVNLGGGNYGSPLGAACYWGHQEIAELLLEKGADVNLGGGEYGSPLGAACYQCHQEIAQLLLEKGADVNLGGGDYGSPLGAACYQGQHEIAQLLLEKGADMNLAGGNYGSPLGAACIKDLEIVSLLLQKGAEINLAGGEYGSALGAASYCGKPEIVQLLLKKGANINLVGGQYGTALGAASFGGELDIVQILLNNGADISLAGGKYGSALVAASAGHWDKQLDTVHFLLKNGADINSQGSWALKEATNAGQHNIVALLHKHGAVIDQDLNSDKV
ncbi:ankyrin repeat-containing domain protein [Mycena galopus ATCC 62051]|nr:ankyrin repeat-containing domain protein [Mycena galopus ATCC 62051]